MLPVTAKKFHIRSLIIIWQWERALESGRLNPSKQRRKNNMTKQDDNKIKKLEKENELLRIKVAYLEKLEALARGKRIYKPRQGGSNYCVKVRIEM